MVDDVRPMPGEQRFGRRRVAEIGMVAAERDHLVASLPQRGNQRRPHEPGRPRDERFHGSQKTISISGFMYATAVDTLLTT